MNDETTRNGMTTLKTDNPPPPPGYHPPLGLAGYGFSSDYTSPQSSEQAAPPSYSSLQNPGQSAPPRYSSLHNPGQPNSSTMIWSSNVVAPAPMSMASTEAPPPDYTNKALIVTFCCCLPLGLCALMKATESKKAFARGDIQTARTSADSARQLTIMGVVAGIASVVVSGVIMAVYIVLVLSSLNTDD